MCAIAPTKPMPPGTLSSSLATKPPSVRIRSGRITCGMSCLKLPARRGRARWLRAGAGEGLTLADSPDHAHWERWFPADWVSEMREQIRLWFYGSSS